MRTIRLLGLLALVIFATNRQPEGAPAGQPAVSADWLGRARQQIAEREYRASRNGHGLQAPNRAHGLRTYFTPSGIAVQDRVAGAELLELKLAAVGRGAKLAPVPAGELSNEGSRVEIRRPGLVEWYANSPTGLEQGFTLAQRPPGEKPLALELALEGASASASGHGLVLHADSGRRLDYAKLAARDAQGRPLAARFELASATRVRVVVEDRGAAYPVSIDPLVTSTSDATVYGAGDVVAGAGDMNGDGFDDVLVADPHFDAGEADEGAVFLFLGGYATGIAGGGPASAAARLEGNQAGAVFGWSVAGVGDVNGDGYDDILVGAPGYDDGETDEGAAFLFLGSASGIGNGSPASAAARLEGNQPNAQLGVSVASAGDVNGDGFDDLLVGAWGYDTPSGVGAAFIWNGSAAGIANGTPATATTRLESDLTGGAFAVSVASAGDVNGDGYDDVLVAAPAYAGVGPDEGAAFVFLGSAAGIPDAVASAAAARLTAGQAGARLGETLAGAGDVNGDGYDDVIVGAPHYGTGSGSGAAFVFLGSASGIASGIAATAATRLGPGMDTVAGAGDVNGDGYGDVLVGSPGYDPDALRGAALVFLGSAAGVANGDATTAAARLTVGPVYRIYSLGVAGAGDVNGDGFDDVLVGAPLIDLAASAYLFLGSAHFADTRLESHQVDALLGASVAGAGDVNGDGYDDVIVGAPYYDAGQGDEGAAFVFLGSAAGIADGTSATAATQLVSDQAGAHLGTSVAGAGDVNGDGYADVIVGAPYYDAGQTDEGAAFVFLGSATGIADGSPATAATRLESDQSIWASPDPESWDTWRALFGASVAGAGDVNGDGYDDVIVGAPSFDVDGDGWPDGAAFVFLGSAAGISNGNPATASTRLTSDQHDFLGTSVAGAGDVNGDGYDDVIVGASNFPAAGIYGGGAAFVFVGGPTGIADGSPATAATRLESNQAGAELGKSVAGAGDVNADGFDDVLVGAPGFDADGDGTSEGAAFLFLGTGAGVADGGPATAATRLHSGQADSWFGRSVAGAGDVNGDGYADVIVGASKYTAGATYEGSAFVFYGRATGIPDGSPTTADLHFESGQAGAALGTSVAGAGDVNGDGYDDLIVGAPAFTNNENNEGVALVFLPEPAPGLSLLAGLALLFVLARRRSAPHV